MKAVILCAKKKETLFPFSETKPTGLTPIMGRPIVWHLIESLENNGITDIHLVTNYREEDFEEEFSGYTNVNLVHQENLSGTGEAVKTCDFIEEDFVIINGDVIVSSKDLENLLNKHKSGNQDMTLLATDENKPEKFGVLSIKDDQINSIQEKPENPENTLINSGIYVTSPEIFQEIENAEADDLTDAVKSFAKSKSAKFELIQDHWIDIGSPEKLWKADQIKRNYLINSTSISNDAEIAETAKITGEAVVRPGAKIKPGTVIEGKVFVGEGTELGPNSVVRDSTINDNCMVRNSTLEKAVLFEENILDAYVSIDSCILGEECSIKSGTSIKESFIGARSFIEVNNSIIGTKFVPDARTDLGEISK